MALGTTGSNARVDIVITIRDAAAIANIKKLTRAEKRLAAQTRRVARGMRQASRNTGFFASTVATLRKAIISMIGIMILWNGVLIPLELAFLGLGKSIIFALGAVAKFREQVIGLKAILATTVKFTEDFNANFRLAGKAADAVLRMFMRRTGEILGTTEDVALVFQTLLATGAGGMVTNMQELAEAAILLNNAIITITPGQEKQRQLASETAALLRGQVRSTDRLAKILQLNATKSKELADNWIKTKGFWGYLQGVLYAFELAGEEIELTWGAITSSYEEFARLISIEAFAEPFTKLRDVAYEFLGYMNDNAVAIELNLAPAAAGVLTIFEHINDILELVKAHPDELAKSFQEVMFILTMGVTVLLDMIRLVVNEIALLIELVNHFVMRLGGGIASAGIIRDTFKDSNSLLGAAVRFQMSYERYAKNTAQIARSTLASHEKMSEILGMEVSGMMDLARAMELVQDQVDEVTKSAEKLADQLQRSAASAKIRASGGQAAQAYAKYVNDMEKIGVHMAEIAHATEGMMAPITQANARAMRSALEELFYTLKKVEQDYEAEIFKFHVKVAKDVAEAQEMLIKESLGKTDILMKGFVSRMEWLSREIAQGMGKLVDAAPAEELNALYGRKFREIMASGETEAFIRHEIDALNVWYKIELQILAEAQMKGLEETKKQLEKARKALAFDLAKSPGVGLGESGLPVGIDAMVEPMIKRARILLQKMRLEVKGVLPPDAFGGATAQIIEFQKDIENVIEMARTFGDVMSQEMVDDIEKLIVAMEGIDAELARQVDAFANYHLIIIQEFKTWMAKITSESHNFAQVFIGVFQYIGKAAIGALGQALAQFITDIATGSEDALKNVGQFIGNLIIMMGQLAVSLGTIAVIGSLIPGFQGVFGIGGVAGAALIAAGAAAIAVGAAMGGGGSRSTGVGAGGAGGIAEVPTFAFEQGNINVQQNLMGAVSGLNNATSNLNSTVYDLTSKSPGVLVNEGLAQQGGILAVSKNAVNQAPSSGRGLGAALAGSGSTGGF